MRILSALICGIYNLNTKLLLSPEADLSSQVLSYLGGSLLSAMRSRRGKCVGLKWVHDSAVWSIGCRRRWRIKDLIRNPRLY